MANFTTSADLVEDALFRAGEPTDGTSDFADAAVRYLNRAYQGIILGGSEIDPEIDEDWWWVRADSIGVLTLQAMYDTGSVSVSNNSTSLTFSATIATSMTGRAFKVDDHADVFIISDHIAGTDTATLDSVYTGSDNAAASYRLMQTDYSLASGVIRVMTPFFGYQDSRGEIPIIDYPEFQKKWPRNELSQGMPIEGTMLDETTIRFSHYGPQDDGNLMRVEYLYAALPSDLTTDPDTTPIVPRHHRKVLADWTLLYLLADKDDTGVGGVAALVRRGLLAMQKENRKRRQTMDSTFGRIIPRQGQRWRQRGPLRTESGDLIG